MVSDPDEILAAIRALPVSERLRLVEHVVHDVANAANGKPGPELLGLMSDEPEVVDQVCSLALDARAKARPRQFDE